MYELLEPKQLESYTDKWETRDSKKAIGDSYHGHLFTYYISAAHYYW